MSKPTEHAKKSAGQFGGKASDYLAIHVFMDSSKAAFADVRHRALTHNTWFITNVLPRVFGETIMNSDHDEVSVRDIGEQHCLDDYQDLFVPSAQDFLSEIELKPWMDNARDGEVPPSRSKVQAGKRPPSLGPTSAQAEVDKDLGKRVAERMAEVGRDLEREGGWTRSCVGHGMID